MPAILIGLQILSISLSLVRIVSGDNKTVLRALRWVKKKHAEGLGVPFDNSQFKDIGP